MNVQHPIASGVQIGYEIRNASYRGVVAACEGQLGTARVWWYRLADGRRVSEYQITYAQQ